LNILFTEKKYSDKLLFAIVALITVLVYFNSLNNQFLNDWDDGTYVTNNPDIKPALDNSLVKNAFTKFSNGHYHPLTTISYGLEYKLFGSEAKPFHVFNLIFHLIATLLVFVFIKLLNGESVVAFITSLLFAIHPMHVESVAWISDRKDLLCTIYFVGALCVYLLYIKKGGTKFYIFTFLLFIAALLSKAMAITLPFVLLVIDYFKDRKISQKVIVEKIPFLVLSVIFGYISVLSQKSNDALGDISALSIIDRLAFSGYSLVMYIVKLVWFKGLSAFYNYPLLENGKYPMLYYIIPLTLFVLAWLLFRMKEQRKLIVFSFGFFLITIALVLQIIPAGNVIMADRYTYLPYIGLFFFIAVMAKKFLSLEKTRNIASGALIIYFIACCYFSFERTKIWHDSMALWNNTIENNPDAALPYNNRANLFIAANQQEKALSDLNKAIEIRPKYVSARFNRALIYNKTNKFKEAIDDLSFVLEHNPRDVVSVYMERGIAYFNTGNYKKSYEDLSEALKLDSKIPAAYFYRGMALYFSRQFTMAIQELSYLIDHDPRYSKAFYMRALSYYELKDYQKAYNDILTAKKMGYAVDEKFLQDVSSKLKP
jgi:tetratricopeptide (TPR) repeat protein